MLRKISLLAVVFVSFVCTAEITVKEYLPSIGGVMRTRFEVETQTGLNRFAVNNARLWLRGNILPQISYYVCADLCNQGSFQFLDAYGRFNLGRGWAIQAGQFRIPFGVDPFRGPGSYIFADRSFIGRDIDNIRADGVQGSFTFSEKTPATITTGIFGTNSIANHNRWSKSFNYAIKAEVPVRPFKFTAGLQSIKPDSTRINMVDACIFFNIGRITAEAEYMFKHYAGNGFPDVHAYNVWVDYAIPLRKTIFNSLSFQGRFDANTPHSNGTYVNGKLLEDHAGRKRITIGSTLSYVKKPLKCEIQLNYEKFFYDKGAIAPPGRNDKVVAELIISF